MFSICPTETTGHLRAIAQGKGWKEKRMDGKDLKAIDTHSMPWQERFNEQVGKALYRKDLIVDPETGMEVRLVRYPAASSTRATPISAPMACMCWRGLWSLVRAIMARDTCSGFLRAWSWNMGRALKQS
jgi:hypothetical protein